jgi:hypothetical protein
MFGDDGRERAFEIAADVVLRPPRCYCEPRDATVEGSEAMRSLMVSVGFHSA